MLAALAALAVVAKRVYYPSDISSSVGSLLVELCSEASASAVATAASTF